MTFKYSKKILLISENARITMPIKHALNKVSIEIVSDYLNLHSLPAIRKAISSTGRTVFLRSELMRFIKEQGYPYAVIMDIRNDLGLGEERDPEKLQLLKTLLISFIILHKGKEYVNLKGNFVLMSHKKTSEDTFHFVADPHKVLDMLMTDNKAINSYIDELKSDEKLFNDLFFIKVLDSEVSSDHITLFIDTFLKGIALRQNPEETTAETAPQTEAGPKAVNEKQAVAGEKPAGIIYRLDDAVVYEDGEAAPMNEEYAAMKEKEFYILGAWSAKTELDVTKKIAGIIAKGLSDKKRFSYNEEIIFNLDDRCLIDKDTALSMAQLFTKNLKAYKKIKIIVSEKNGSVITKARGFPMMKEILSVSGEKT